MASPSDTISGKDSATLEKGQDGPDLADISGVPSEQKPVDPKEGGTKAWLTVAGSVVGMFVSFGWVNCIGIFQAEYETNQLKDYSSSEVAWITSLECKIAQVCPPFLAQLRRSNLTN